MRNDLQKTLKRVLKKYGNVEADSLGCLYSDGLMALERGSKEDQILASDALVEWEKHHLGGHSR